MWCAPYRVACASTRADGSIFQSNISCQETNNMLGAATVEIEPVAGLYLQLGHQNAVSPLTRRCAPPCLGLPGQHDPSASRKGQKRLAVPDEVPSSRRACAAPSPRRNKLLQRSGLRSCEGRRSQPEQRSLDVRSQNLRNSKQNEPVFSRKIDVARKRSAGATTHAEQSRGPNSPPRKQSTNTEEEQLSKASTANKKKKKAENIAKPARGRRRSGSAAHAHEGYRQLKARR